MQKLTEEDGRHFGNLVMRGTTDAGVEKIITAVNRLINDRDGPNRADSIVACCQILAQSVLSDKKISAEIHAAVISIFSWYVIKIGGAEG